MSVPFVSKPILGAAVAAISVSFVLSATPLYAQASASHSSTAHAKSGDDKLDAFGTPDPSKLEYSQFAYFRGQWVTSMIMINEAGEKIPLENTSRITGFYHADGRTFQTCFRTKGFYSTDIRAYDESSDEWRAHFLNARSQRWSHSNIKKIGDQMITMVPGGYSGKEDFDIKTVVHDIHEDGFSQDVFRSTDGGMNWVKTYEMSYARPLDNSDMADRC